MFFRNIHIYTVSHYQQLDAIYYIRLTECTLRTSHTQNMKLMTGGINNNVYYLFLFCFVF